MKREIFVIGTGIIGSTYAWLFSEAGHETIHYVRSGKLEQSRRMIEGHIGHSPSEIEAMLAELARMAGKMGRHAILLH